MLMGYKLLMWIGILMIALPFLGVPIIWKELALFIMGLILLTRSLLMKSREERVFTENNFDNA